MWSLILTAMLAAPTTQLSEQGFTSLNAQSHHLIDMGQDLRVTTVLEEFLSGQTSSASTMSLGFDSAAHWFATNVHNPHPTAAWVFELEYPLLDYVDVYVVREDGDIEHSSIGDRHPFSERYFPSRFLHIPLGLDAGETVTILWRVTTHTSIIAGARIAPHDLWVTSRSTESDIKLFIYGLIFMVMSYQLILSYWTGDKSSLWVAISAGTSLLVLVSLEGIASRFLSFLPIDFRKILTLVGLGLASGAYLMLLNSLFKVRELSPRRSKILVSAAASFFTISVITLFVGYAAARVYPLIVLAMCILFIETLVWANRKRLRAAFVADLALLSIIVPPALNSQRYSGLLENSPLLENLNSIGLSLGFLAFSVAVADQMLMKRREREALLVEVQTSQNALQRIEESKINLEAQNVSLQKDMQYASQKLTDADQMATLGTMMAGIIHDMNNPLQFISGLDQVYAEHHRELQTLLNDLLGEADGPEAEELRTIIRNHFGALSQSTNDLKLGTSKLKALNTAMRNSARRDPSPGHHPLRSIVDESITILGSKLKLHTLSCVFQTI